MSVFVAPDAVHGTYNAYVNRACRCSECKAVASEYRRDRRDVNYGRMVRGEVSPPHGTRSTYINYMCRCDECREAGRIANADYRRRVAR